MDESLIAGMLASTLRVSTPLILCALAGLLAERSGVVDIGLEGKMLFGAFAAGAIGALYGSIGLALAAAISVAVLLSWMHGLACVSYRGDQVVSGVAINIIASGMTVVIGIALFAQGGHSFAPKPNGGPQTNGGIQRARVGSRGHRGSAWRHRPGKENPRRKNLPRCPRSAVFPKTYRPVQNVRWCRRCRPAARVRLSLYPRHSCGILHVVKLAKSIPLHSP